MPDKQMEGFASIAQYLSDPLVLTGFGLLLFFGFAHGVLRSGLLRQVNQSQSYDLLKRLILFGFLGAVAVTVLAFGLKYRELSKAEQTAAVRTICTELAENRNTARELAKNSATILNNATIVANALREDSQSIMGLMFPAQNIDSGIVSPSAFKMATQRMELLDNSGKLDSRLERARFELSAQAIASTIQNTGAAMQSLSDMEGKRYVMVRAAWNANQSVIRRISIVDLSELESVYHAFEVSRANYNTVVSYAEAYLQSVRRLLAPEDMVINQPRLAEALAAERIFFDVANSYGNSLIEQIELAEGTLDRMNCRV